MLVLLSIQKHHVIAKNILENIWMTYEQYLQFSKHNPLNVFLQLIWIIPCIFRFISKAFITKRRKTWNKNFHFYRVLLLLQIKSIASFEERRNHNNNTSNVKAKSSSGQSKTLSKNWWTFQMWLNCSKARGFLKPQQDLSRHLNLEVAINQDRLYQGQLYGIWLFLISVVIQLYQ